MIFTPLAIAGAYRISLERREDHRGFFARTFCEAEFTRLGIPSRFLQQSIAHSDLAGTLRGFHLQLEPDGEDKLIRVVRGAIFDTFIDLRRSSPTFLAIVSCEIDAAIGDALFVPRGCAHAYQTLSDATDVLYAMSSEYSPARARSIKYNDPHINVDWPVPDPILSDADTNAPSLQQVLDEICR